MAMGIDKYNAECRAIVMRYSSEWRRTVERLGRWIDFDNDYKTLNTPFMESVWWVFGQLWKKDLVYRGLKVMPYTTGCTTPLSNFEAGQAYKDVQDPAGTPWSFLAARSVEEPRLTLFFFSQSPSPSSSSRTPPSLSSLGLPPPGLFPLTSPSASTPSSLTFRSTMPSVTASSSSVISSSPPSTRTPSRPRRTRNTPSSRPTKVPTSSTRSTLPSSLTLLRLCVPSSSLFAAILRD